MSKIPFEDFKEACKAKFTVGSIIFLSKRRLNEWNRLDPTSSPSELELRDASPLIIQALYGCEPDEKAFPSLSLIGGPSFILDEKDLEDIEVVD